MDNLDVAIIGMMGRFPMADTIEKMWQNIKDGKGLHYKKFRKN